MARTEGGAAAATLRIFPGAALVREAYCPGAPVREHSHDCLALSFPLLGGFTSLSEAGEARLEGPSAILHPAGRPHASRVSGEGLETLGLFLDRGWLARAGLGREWERTCSWRGGRGGASALRLARLWMDPRLGEDPLRSATAAFLAQAPLAPRPPEPRWMGAVDEAVMSGHADVPRLADRLGLHPGWLLQAYRAAKGEGLHETLRRRRLSSAWAMLRSTDRSLAGIAADCGFYDQSHMSRSFRAVLGRTPLEVRRGLGAPWLSR